MGPLGGFTCVAVGFADDGALCVPEADIVCSALICGWEPFGGYGCGFKPAVVPRLSSIWLLPPDADAFGGKGCGFKLLVVPGFSSVPVSFAPLELPVSVRFGFGGFTAGTSRERAAALCLCNKPMSAEYPASPSGALARGPICTVCAIAC